MTDQLRLPTNIWLDLINAKLHKDNGEIALTPRAFALLHHLVTHPARAGRSGYARAGA